MLNLINIRSDNFVSYEKESDSAYGLGRLEFV